MSVKASRAAVSLRGGVGEGIPDVLRARLTGDGGVWAECLLGKNGTSSLPDTGDPQRGLVERVGCGIKNNVQSPLRLHDHFG